MLLIPVPIYLQLTKANVSTEVINRVLEEHINNNSKSYFDDIEDVDICGLFGWDSSLEGYNYWADKHYDTINKLYYLDIDLYRGLIQWYYDYLISKGA